MVTCMNDQYEATHYGEDEDMPLCPECATMYEDDGYGEAVPIDEV